MACEHPIWIRNRRYYDKKRPRVGLGVDADHKSALALRPWDVARQWIMVPCGHCKDCLRRQRNDWFVRLERELARCKAESRQAIFITITISPKYYNEALLDPARFIRRWNERIRHRIGHSFKHAFFQEFGTHPETGSDPRLHFHGFLFGTDALYSVIRSAVSDLGYVWLAKANVKRARYCVKYVTKQIKFDPVEVAGKTVNINGNEIPLSALLQHRRYTRKFISAGVGDYLGIMSRPTDRVRLWSYSDHSFLGRTFNYAIPRYYDRYLTDAEKDVRAVLAADAYARFSRSSLVRRVVSKCVEIKALHSAVSSRASYCWELKKAYEFRGAGCMPDIDPPVWLDRDILQFWYDQFGLKVA